MPNRKPGSPDTSAVETPFFIPATNLPARPHRTLKHDDTFAIFDSHGDIGAASGEVDGLFHSDTRYISRFELLFNGLQPLLLSSTVTENSLYYDVDLTNPDIFNGDTLVFRKDTVHIGRTLYLLDGSIRQRIALANHGTDNVKFSLTMVFASDFADIFEVRGIRRSHRGRVRIEVAADDAVQLSYHGLDNVVRETRLGFEPAPTSLSGGSATFQFELAPAERCSLFVTAARGEPSAKPAYSFFKGITRLNRERHRDNAGAAGIETSDATTNAVLKRAMLDLDMLTTDTPVGRYPYAGIPWYSTTFGRDGIITALQTLWLKPQLTRGVLQRLAHFQAKSTDLFADAEPGKIVHEMRGGEMAALHEVPFGLYYGSVDTTPLFVILAGRYLERTGDDALIGELWPAIEAALAWIDGPGDRDGDGFVEYSRGKATGLANQGWKDSFDAVFHADGRLADGPIALVEVQAYVYAARMAAAACARRTGRTERAETLERQAQKLAQAFDAAFWCPDIGTYALALDGDKRPCRVRTSNAGQTLFTGIVPPDRAEQVATGLFKAPFFSGWGIRTVAMGEARYNPMSYHNGSIWPHDNSLIALGLARNGLTAGVATLFEALMRVATHMEHVRLPELYCGFKRRLGRGPTLYPAACSPQAWASGAPLLMLQSMLGLSFDPDGRTIRLQRPRLPAATGDISIRNLRLGGRSADFCVTARSGGATLHSVRTDPGLEVKMEPA